MQQKIDTCLLLVIAGLLFWGLVLRSTPRPTGRFERMSQMPYAFDTSTGRMCSYMGDTPDDGSNNGDVACNRLK